MNFEFVFCFWNCWKLVFFRVIFHWMEFSILWFYGNYNVTHFIDKQFNWLDFWVNFLDFNNLNFKFEVFMYILFLIKFYKTSLRVTEMSPILSFVTIYYTIQTQKAFVRLWWLKENLGAHDAIVSDVNLKTDTNQSCLTMNDDVYAVCAWHYHV